MIVDALFGYSLIEETRPHHRVLLYFRGACGSVGGHQYLAIGGLEEVFMGITKSDCRPVSLLTVRGPNSTPPDSGQTPR